MKYFVTIIIIIVTVTVIGGFFVVGSPQQERLRRFDERRIQDLQVIQSEIINYWMRKESLPENTAVLRDDIRGFIPSTDPQTGGEYGYQIKNFADLIFELCANFVTSNLGGGNNFNTPQMAYPYPRGMYPEQQNWQHDKGLVCFERKIDPELYKPEKPRF